MRAPEEQVHLVFNLESQRVRALTVVRHSAVSVCVVTLTIVGCGAVDDLVLCAIFYSFRPINAWIFCFRRLMALSTELTELPRSLAISSLEKPSAF